MYGSGGVVNVHAGFLLLFIYAMINMNIVSWGTREVAQTDDVDVDVANRVKQPKVWRTFIHEVRRRLLLLYAIRESTLMLT